MTLTSVLRLGRAPKKLSTLRKTGPSYPLEKVDEATLAEVREFFPGTNFKYSMYGDKRSYSEVKRSVLSNGFLEKFLLF